MSRARRRRAAIGAAAGAAFVAAAAGGAPRFPAALVGAVQGEAESGPVLLGESGQLYRPAGDGWRRTAPGGVSRDLVGAVRAPGGALFGVGGRTPIFRRDDGVWSAEPLPNRGRTALSVGGGAAALSVDRYVYLLDGDAWRRRGAAPGEVTALWVSDPSRIYAATENGSLHRGRGRSWTSIRSPLEDDDRVVSLVGRPGRELYAIARSGAVLEVRSRRARPVEPPVELAGLDVQAAGYLPDGTPAVAGALREDGAGDGDKHGDGPGAALAALRDGELVMEAALPAPGNEDRFAVVTARDGAAVVATRDGAVHVREGDGWRSARATTELPAEARRDGERSRVAPARTR